MNSKQIIVSGTVQGVGFRVYTLKVANRLGIVGWARNLFSSEVEIYAQSKDREAMENFILEIKKGPSRSKVENIEIIEVDSPSLNCDTFSIEPDGEKKREF
jgi:acylphosphatase